MREFALGPLDRCPVDANISPQRAAVGSLRPVLVVGFAMLGALTFVPIYLGYVDGASATASGLRPVLVVGFAMLGALTFVPIYLGYVDGASATASGDQR